MNQLTLTHLSFPLKVGPEQPLHLEKQFPGFLIPIFSSGDKLYVQKENPSKPVTYVPVERSDAYVNINEGQVAAVRRYLGSIDIANEPIHAFFDGDSIVIASEDDMREYLANNLDALTLQVGTNEPYAVLAILDFLGKEEADNVRHHLDNQSALPTVTSSNRVAVAVDSSMQSTTRGSELHAGLSRFKRAAATNSSKFSELELRP